MTKFDIFTKINIEYISVCILTKANKYTDTIIRVGIMKKIWKNVFVGAMIAGAMTGVVGCGKNTNTNVSVDLDGDGVISEWEEVFEAMDASDRTVYKTIKNIGSLSELKAIDGKDKDTAYVLTRNIDCNGETLAINIGTSNYLYGNNKIIRNFKLGKATFDEEDEGSGFKSYLADRPKASSYCLFYNAGAIYDLRVFMGNQTFAPNDQDNFLDVSAFNSVQLMDNVTIKGAVKVKPHVEDAYKTFNLALGLIDHTDEKIEVSNIETIGIVSYEDCDPNRQSAEVVNIAGVIPKIGLGSMVYNANVRTNISVDTKSPANVGLVVSQNEGFISSCTASGNIDALCSDSSTLKCGGIAGISEQLSEIKNCTMSGKINFASNVSFATDYRKTSKAYVGGIVGKTDFAVINYVTNDGEIIGNNLTNVVVGGICGEASNTIFSNIIARGSIGLTNVDGLTVANVSGKMAYGLVEKTLAITNINIDNTAYDLGTVRLGMVTVFETGSVDTFEDDERNVTTYYDMFSDDQKMPEFANILVSGTNTVYTQKTTSSTSKLEYALGLRDPFLYKDELGDELASYLPYTKLFSNLFYLENYSLTHYENDNGQNSKVNLNIVYPEYGAKEVKKRATTFFGSPTNFKEYVGFVYGGSHSEVDLSGLDASNPQNVEPSFSTIRFTLNEASAITGYFDDAHYNSELSRFDRKFEIPYDLGDENFSASDELFSFINYYVKFDFSSLSNKYMYMPLLFNTKFFSGTVTEVGEDSEATQKEISSVGLFEERVCKILEKMNCAVDVKCYTLDGSECDVSAENLSNIEFTAYSSSSDATYTYTFNFDVRNFMKTLDNTSGSEYVLIDENGTSYYLINLLYKKV